MPCGGDATGNEGGGVLGVGRYPVYFRTLQAGRTIAADVARSHPGTAEFAAGYLDQFGITSMLDVPIRREDQVSGVLCLEHGGPARTCTADEQNFGASLADLVALAFEADRRRRYTQRLKILRSNR